jgi:hypothetical protein
MLPRIAVLITILLVFPPHSGTAQTALVAVRTPLAMIQEAEEAFASQLREVMRRSAEALGIALNTTDLAYAGSDDLLVVIAGAHGFETAASAEPTLLTDVGLLYLSHEATVGFGDGELGRRLPAGFHALRLEIDQTRSVHDPGITILEMAPSVGAATVDLPLTLLPAATARDLAVCLGVDADGATTVRAAWFGLHFSLELELRVMQDE